jgi:hypothetical protein
MTIGVIDRIAPLGAFPVADAKDVVSLSETQATWYIDPLTGNDDNDGATSLTALASWAGLLKRLGPAPLLRQTTTINILSSLNVLDLVTISHIRNLSGSIIIQGVSQVVAVGILTGVTALDVPTNQPFVLQDSLVADWTPHLGKIIRITSGLRINDYGVLDENLGGGSVRVTGLIDGSNSAFVSAAPSDPIIGDTYEVLDPTYTTITPSITSFARFQTSGVFIRDLAISTTSSIQLGPLGASNNGFVNGTTLQRCKLTGTHLGAIRLVGTWWSGTTATVRHHGSGVLQLRGSRVSTPVGYFGCSSNAYYNFLDNTIIRCRVKAEALGCIIQASYPFGTYRQRALGLYGALQLECELGGMFHVTDALYGSVTTSTGTIVVDNSVTGNWRHGWRLLYTGTPKVVASNGVDFYISGATQFLPNLEAYAGGSLPALSPCTTWAQLVAAPFNGSLFYNKLAVAIVPT